ncbi:MAG: glycogen synthase GlgA [Lachnospiraceae bacterium]|jgi:starch synthase|nr:glycogen synthase GlgA [Lachnospiraceae bacterium]MCH4029321.1 glycogen synthase GlgA [Lachnospiraceae bacterium]MCH4067828.1 glycogen synthase GlgA [Lachnospiraceae bacterium]MCH4113852.1 glycogen synthase GlgA [Lachnospiraceae bacterium]MCI1352643.1 glycogen synthase GlgA [Lachnospiraceae bacterium]
MKNVLFAASEGVPFIKTGGLADVVGSLPKNLDRNYYDVRVILPKYSCMKQEMKDKLEYITNFYMDYNWKSQYVGLFKAEQDGITYYFIDNEFYFTSFRPYTDDPIWEIERFGYFSKAVLSALPVLGFRPDLIHCHDWQTGLIPVYLKERFQGNEFFRGIKTVMTIHNLKFQGRWNVKDVQQITGLSDYYFTPDKLEFNKDADLLKGGIVYADAVTTVSPTYAEEIKTPFYGEGLDGLLRARSGDLRGILNGIDYDVFSPDIDKYIPSPYNAINFRKEKVKNKTALQQQFGLEKDEKCMMIGIVSRLTDQKGFDLIAYVMDELCQDAVQIVVLGTGEERYENMFRYFAWKYGNKVSAQICYSDELSHKIYAASDAFLMPSLFEPCGLSQLMALRYGTLPIVRETGGLKDTVEPYNEYEGTGTGFSFANYNAHEMLRTIRYAEQIYYDRRREWNKMIDRAMAVDFSWKRSAEKYQEMYDWLIGG